MAVRPQGVHNPYDALGRAVETSYEGAYTEIWYTQLGKAVYMQGSTPFYAYFPTPGGGTVEVNGNAATNYYMHKDWLGNSRISSTVISHTVISDQAYAPFGEVYNKEATGAATPGQMFTGDVQNIISGIFDTPNRELNASQGRWLSPDPANSGWNQYGYVSGNPLSYIDPSGLACWPFEKQVVGTCSGFMNGVDFGANWDEFITETTSTLIGFTNHVSTIYIDPDTGELIGTPLSETAVYETSTSLVLASGAANNGSWWSGLVHSPWLVSWILPLWPLPPAAGVGPAGSIAWNPATKTLCGSLGAGASVGDNLAAGPVAGRTTNGQQVSPSQINQIFSGWSANFGFNVPIGPVPAGPGVQVSANGSGVVYGPTGGVAGAREVPGICSMAWRTWTPSLSWRRRFPMPTLHRSFELSLITTTLATDSPLAQW